jgi:predicted nucleotidyltransferase
VTESTVSAIDADRRFQEGQLVRPADLVDLKRAEIRDAVSRNKAANPRVFGSALHGADAEGSDLDILVNALPGATLFDLGGLQIELQELLGVEVDLLTPEDLPPAFRARVLAEAAPV